MSDKEQQVIDLEERIRYWIDKAKIQPEPTAERTLKMYASEYFKLTGNHYKAGEK